MKLNTKHLTSVHNCKTMGHLNLLLMGNAVFVSLNLLLMGNAVFVSLNFVNNYYFINV